MQGAGNDFVVLDFTKKAFDLKAVQIQRLADRHFGVGCDQVLVVEKPRQRENDFRYRIFNADGGEVEQCGNGARCFVKFVHARGLTLKRELRVETLGGTIAPRLEDDGEVSVDMGPPKMESPLVQPLEVDGTRLELAMLFITHDLRVAAQVCDQVAVMQEGRIVEYGPAREVFLSPRHEYTKALFAAAPGRGFAFGG